MKKLALCMAILAIATSASAKDWSTVRFGVDASYAPFESKAADGKLVGFDIDVGNEICKRLNAKCVWVESAFDGMIPALKARKFDGVLSSMSMTPQREAQIAFSARLFQTPTRLVAKKGSTFQPTADALKGKTVGFISNGKEGTKAYFAHLERLLRSELGVANVVWCTKSNYSAPADAHIVDEIKRWHAAVAGVGD